MTSQLQQIERLLCYRHNLRNQRNGPKFSSDWRKGNDDAAVTSLSRGSQACSPAPAATQEAEHIDENLPEEVDWDIQLEDSHDEQGDDIDWDIAAIDDTPKELKVKANGGEKPQEGEHFRSTACASQIQQPKPNFRHRLSMHSLLPYWLAIGTLAGSKTCSRNSLQLL